MKKVINHKGWFKSLLFIPILFISEIVSAFGLIFSGFEIPNLGAGSSISELVLGFQKFSALIISLILIALFMKFIDMIIDLLRKNGNVDVVIVTGYLKEH